MRAEELLETLTDDELKERANACLIKAESTDFYLQVNAAERHRLLAEADFYLNALIWRSDAQVARRDFLMEVAVIVLIGMEIALAIIFGILGYQEATKQQIVLDNMAKSTAQTALAMDAATTSLQKLADEQAASLQILQDEQVARSKKPRFGLYLGAAPISNAFLRLADHPGQALSMANFTLTLKNEGDAPASPSEIHILIPDEQGIYFALSPLLPVPELEEPSKPATRRFTYSVPLLPVGKTLRFSGTIGAAKGHSSFKAIFTITTPQLQAVTPLGSLAILPPKS